MFEFKIPEVGENIESGNVVSIAVSVGDTVKKDQELLELETDKASLPVPSPVDGIIKEILIKEGDDVAIGQVIMKIANESEAEPPAQEDTAVPSEPPDTAPASEPPKEEPKAKIPSQPSAPTTAPRPSVATALKANVDIPAQTDVPAAPSVRRLARELGLEISNVPGTGPGGRISKDDVKTFAKSIIQGTAALPAAKPAKPLPDFSKFGNVERESMNKVRQVTAEQMSMSWNTIPHVTQFDKADITEVEQLRKKLSTPERKLTITPFLLKVMADALKEFPQFNCSIDIESKEIIYKKYFNLGVAVDTERGLLVPVIKDVEKKTIFEITDELNEMAERARNKKTKLDELQGACMTLTNLGGIGGYAFTPIVNWPEVCILGVSRGGFEPIYNKESGNFEPRFKLPFSLSYDHRIIDGADAARFLRFICEAIEKTSEKDVEN